MKKLISLFYVFGICCCFTCESYGQSARYRELLAYVKSKGYSIKTEQKAKLKKGEKAHHTAKFYEGRDYVLIGMSDDTDVNDVDLFLRETDETLHTKNTDSENIAIFEFSPSFTRNMEVVIKNYDTSTPNYSSTCRFIIGYK